MIPKKIHYCWFGRGEKPPLAEKCIASWKKHCPDYEIIEWNEDNFDLAMNGYTRMCLAEKKYAFLSDYARLVILEKEGGIYFDTDVEVVRSFDRFLKYPAFLGFEDDDHVNTGIGFGAEAGSHVVRAMLTDYDQFLYGNSEVTVCPILNTQALVKCGLVLN
jgi:mannosyltransferase OCH1-like enzyme